MSNVIPVDFNEDGRQVKIRVIKIMNEMMNRSGELQISEQYSPIHNSEEDIVVKEESISKDNV